jgi:hypothetical protein
MNVIRPTKAVTHTASQKYRHPRIVQSITVVRMAAMAEMVPAKAANMSRVMTALSLATASEKATFSTPGL